MKINKVYNGNSLEVLKTFPDESINMCITSPPYWGLRDYGTENQIWGGDYDCEHEWGEVKGIKAIGRDDKYFGGVVGADGLSGVKKRELVDSNICGKCGAWEGELGLEPYAEMYVNNLCDIFDEVKRCLTPDGSCWVNIGDTYANTGYGKGTGSFKNKNNPRTMTPKVKSDLPQKCLVQIPSRFAIEMTNRGWILRNEIIWHKPSCLPTPAKDRFTVDFEKLYFFTKNKKYYFKQQLEPMTTDPHAPGNKLHKDKISGPNDRGGKSQWDDTSRVWGKDNMRNKRAVWSINTSTFKGAHFAVYPPKLIESPIDAGCPVGGTVLDPFFGSGTSAEVAMEQDKNWVGIDLNTEYIEISDSRLRSTVIVKKTEEKGNEFWG